MKDGECMKITWDQLIELEPRLLDLYNKAKACKQTEGFCANRVWYGGLKKDLCGLVGWNCKSPSILNTEAAYEIAYDKVYSALPDCIHEGEMCW